MNGRTPANWLIAVLLCACFCCTSVSLGDAASGEKGLAEHLFSTADRCIACHSSPEGKAGPAGYIGHAWWSTMMANSARDPYWQAAVRREVIDHPEQAAAIEDACATCHMPMARIAAQAREADGAVFAHLEGSAEIPLETELAMDGVSCAVCHRIEPGNFGEHTSFDGGFRIDTSASKPSIYGPFEIDAGRQRIMHSATEFTPQLGSHIQESELCATCHTLFTTALDDAGEPVGRFPEQVPYLEWRHSSYLGDQSCQDCHMPVVPAPMPITSVLGEPREGLSEHAFQGGNAFMLRILDRYRDELGVTTPSDEIAAAVQRTEDHLATRTASLGIVSAGLTGSNLNLDVEVRNVAGHKLPTAYPSRRVWLELQVIDSNGRTLFESGALRADGSIVGNDNDADPLAFEPHHTEITRADQVQIYEPILLNSRNEVTTGLLHAVGFAKDNRLLPAGFDKNTAAEDIAVHGAAADDDDFSAGGDRVRYRVRIEPGVRQVDVKLRLRFQTIGYRWAQNLSSYEAPETRRFVRYYEDNAAESSSVLAEMAIEIAASH